MENKVYQFSAPGRTEIGGNHTDHQHGCVLAASINLETTAQVRINQTNLVNIQSEGYEPFTIDIQDLNKRIEEENTTKALVRGILYAFKERGAALAGFDASIQSSVLPGSGMSSSASFEVLIATIVNTLFFENQLTAIQIAQISQWVENEYFGKPCGLMDQMACSVGNLVYIDFKNPEKPIGRQIKSHITDDYALCIIDTGANHANLNDAYASIPKEMKGVAAHFGCEFLRDVNEEDFYANISVLRKEVGDRAVLRAMHFFDENKRAQKEVEALENQDIETFLKLVTASGDSSWQLLQNITVEGNVEHQEVAVSLALAKKYLNGRGAVRIHGGGFAGTIQAFVPMDMKEEFVRKMEETLGVGSCHLLQILPFGGRQLD